MKVYEKGAFAGWALLGAIGLFIVIGATFYHFVEHLSWLDATFFSVITATTVGYGNIAPHTAAGKIFTMFYIFFSIIFVFTFVNHFSVRTGKGGLFRRFFSDKDKK